MPLSYWAEALHTTNHLLNLDPIKTQHKLTPFQFLFGRPPIYTHLHVFGYRCYPNLLAKAPNKLLPFSTKCVFIGYPSNYKGYRCLNLSTNHIILFRHVVFDEDTFPFSNKPTTPTSSYDFLYVDASGLPHLLRQMYFLLCLLDPLSCHLDFLPR